MAEETGPAAGVTTVQDPSSTPVFSDAPSEPAAASTPADSSVGPAVEPDASLPRQTLTGNDHLSQEDRFREIAREAGMVPAADIVNGDAAHPNAPMPVGDGAAIAQKAEVAEDAAKATPSKLGTFAGLSKDLYKTPVAGIQGLAKTQYQVGSDLAAKGLTKVGLAASAKTAARFVPVVGSALGAYLAYKSFKEGDYVGSVLNLVGVIPGPIGWIGMGAAAVWDTFKPHQTFGMWEAPDGTSTHMLPGSAKDVAGVQELDAKLREAQQLVFSFQDGPSGTVWNENHPAPLSLNTPEVSTALTSWLGGLSDLFAQVDQTMKSAGEPYFDQYRSELAPHLEAMAKLKDHAKIFGDQLAAVSAGGRKCYQGVLDTNKAARSQLATDGALTDQGALSAPQMAVQAGTEAIRGANDKLTKLFAQAPPAVVTSKAPTATPATTGSEKSQVTTKPATPVANASPLSEAGKSLGEKKDDLSKLLSGLGNKTPSGGSPLGGGSPFGGGGNPAGGTPLNTPTSKSTPSEPKKLIDDKKDETKKRDDKSLSAAKPDNKTTPAAPADKVPGPAPLVGNPTPGTPRANPGAAKPDTTVDVKGEKVKFPNAKLAKLAQLLASADPTHPVSLADAAAQSGLTPPVPGQDPGKQIPPADAKQGDFLVSGDKRYMLLGDGKFYDLTEFKTVGASELPQDMGARAGYFRLNDPTEGNPGAAGPVSGPTPGVPFNVPGATAAPVGPADTSVPPLGQTGHPPTGTGAHQGPADPPPSVPSNGTPGVPKPGTGGPANAAATDTGTGTSVPSATTPKLDPSAVR